MSLQLGFDLPSRPALGRESFFVAPSNAFAMSMIEDWQNWSLGKLVLSGPAGSGKTHLSTVWSDLSGARLIAAVDVLDHPLPDLAAGPIAVEDMPDIAGNSALETQMFHLHNLALEMGHQILFTGTGPVAGWGIALPDLKSRLMGAPLALLEPPDDTLLSMLLVKLFSDRQLNTKPNLISYLLPRIERSFAAANAVVEQLDAASLAQQRPINRELARHVWTIPPQAHDNRVFATPLNVPQLDQDMAPK